MTKAAADIVADYWATDHKAAKPRSWLEHPSVLRHVNRRVTGDADVNGVTWFQRNYVPTPAKLALSLGCGLGGFERDAVRMGISNKFHANDISSGAIRTATDEAAKSGLGDRITYSVIDLDVESLPVKSYDLVFGLSSVHHVFQLEHLFKQIRSSMTPGGLFYLDEYVGPTRFQTNPFVTDAINRIRGLLPADLLANLFSNDGSSIGTYVPSTVEHFEIHDPSEAVRSAEIIPTLKMYFDVLEYRPYGGTLAHMLLSGITGNFEQRNPAHESILNLIMMMDEELETRMGGSDFAVLVAKAK